VQAGVTDDDDDALWSASLTSNVTKESHNTLRFLISHIK
jgi:hypothetical protein